jgi:Skp family chaperone for outer membrane proteins
MKKLIDIICSRQWGSVFSILVGLSILVLRDAPKKEVAAAFDYVGALSYFLLIFGGLLLVLYATASDRAQPAAAPAAPAASGKRVASEEKPEPRPDDAVARLQQELSARVKEAADFKAAIERKNAELDSMRAKLNRKDLAGVNEAVAALFQSVEFLCERAASGKEAADKVLPQIAEAADELIVAAQLEKGRPNPGDRLADLPPNSCTIFNRIPSDKPEQKGLLVEVRNSWVGFRSDAQLVIINPSRVSVYV